MINYTENYIKNVFRHLCQNTPIEKITITRIIEECKINRNTFYYHYNNIDNLINDVMKDIVKEINDRYEKDKEDYFICFFNTLMLYKKEVLYQSSHDMSNYILNKIYETCGTIANNYLKLDNKCSKFNKLMYSNILRLYKNLMFSFVYDWINCGCASIFENGLLPKNPL